MDVTSKIKVVEVFGEKVSVRHKDLSMALGLVDQYWALRKESER